MEEGIAEVTIKDMYQDGIVRLSRRLYGGKARVRSVGAARCIDHLGVTVQNSCAGVWTIA